MITPGSRCREASSLRAPGNANVNFWSSTSSNQRPAWNPDANRLRNNTPLDLSFSVVDGLELTLMTEREAEELLRSRAS